jgi:hypothetical protein
VSRMRESPDQEIQILYLEGLNLHMPEVFQHSEEERDVLKVM